MTCDVKEKPLSVRMCRGTYACCVKICMSDFITDAESRFFSGTVDR